MINQLWNNQGKRKEDLNLTKHLSPLEIFDGIELDYPFSAPMALEHVPDSDDESCCLFELRTLLVLPGGDLHKGCQNKGRFGEFYTR